MTLSFGRVFASFFGSTLSLSLLSGRRMAPRTWPASHSFSSRTSTRTAFLSSSFFLTVSSESFVCSAATAGPTRTSRKTEASTAALIILYPSDEARLCCLSTSGRLRDAGTVSPFRTPVEPIRVRGLYPAIGGKLACVDASRTAVAHSYQNNIRQAARGGEPVELVRDFDHNI